MHDPRNTYFPKGQVGLREHQPNERPLKGPKQTGKHRARLNRRNSNIASCCCASSEPRPRDYCQESIEMPSDLRPYHNARHGARTEDADPKQLPREWKQTLPAQPKRIWESTMTSRRDKQRKEEDVRLQTGGITSFHPNSKNGERKQDKKAAIPWLPKGMEPETRKTKQGFQI